MFGIWVNKSVYIQKLVVIAHPPDEIDIAAVSLLVAICDKMRGNKKLFQASSICPDFSSATMPIPWNAVSAHQSRNDGKIMCHRWGWKSEDPLKKQFCKSADACKVL